MEYLPPELIIDNPEYIQIVLETDQMGDSKMNRISHYTRIPSLDGWDTVLYYRFIGSITPNNSPNNKSGGYVYILTNDAYPDLIKIGMTTSTSERRLKGVNGSGVVDDWKVEWDYNCFRPWDLEQAVHLKLDSFRERNDREFFRVSIKQAIEIIEDIGPLFGKI
jgi:hypothetical protein